MKIRNKGFKTSSCGKVSCLGCSIKPPSPSLVQCQIDPSELTDEIVSQKKDVGTIGSRKKEVKGKKQRKKKDE